VGNFQKETMKPHFIIEFYKLGKAIFAFGVAFYFAYLFALIPLEFKAKEMLDSSRIEVSYYEKHKNESNEYKLLIAKGRLETAKNEDMKIDTLVNDIKFISMLFFIIAAISWIFCAYAWFFTGRNEKLIHKP
jgi:hypothetical protein